MGRGLVPASGSQFNTRLVPSRGVAPMRSAVVCMSYTPRMALPAAMHLGLGRTPTVDSQEPP